MQHNNGCSPAKQQPVTVLPSVGRLQALRKLSRSRAAQPYNAFGNPLLVPVSVAYLSWV